MTDLDKEFEEERRRRESQLNWESSLFSQSKEFWNDLTDDLKVIMSEINKSEEKSKLTGGNLAIGNIENGVQISQTDSILRVVMHGKFIEAKFKSEQNRTDRVLFSLDKEGFLKTEIKNGLLFESPRALALYLLRPFWKKL